LVARLPQVHLAHRGRRARLGSLASIGREPVRPSRASVRRCPGVLTRRTVSDPAIQMANTREPCVNAISDRSQ